MRSEISKGGPGEGGKISAAWRIKTFVANGVYATSTATAGGATAIAAFNRASGEWSPSQHFCSGLGEAGADSWQPESIGTASGAMPMVQEACNNSTAIAANMATVPLTRNIDPNAIQNSGLKPVFNFTAS
jgi:hypothetical protein